LKHNFFLRPGVWRCTCTQWLATAPMWHRQQSRLYGNSSFVVLCAG